MIKPPRKISLLVLAIIVAISLGSLVIHPGLRHILADVAPPVPPQGSDLFPAIGTTQVRMVSEYVLIDIAGYSSYISGHANITASFTFRNLGESLEQMRVRFPLNHTEYDLKYELEKHEDHCPYSPMAPLQALRVWLDGVEVETVITYKRMIDDAAPPSQDFQPVYTDEPCWAHFDVTFPPGQDVEVKVSYIAPGYSYSGYASESLQFSYILATGAGWNGTIGSADIVARFPYDVNETNVAWCTPEDCTLSGKEVSWHFEDFEPEDNIELYVTNPMIWMRILEESGRVQSNPSDGEAWGRLGKAYKEAGTGAKGMLDVGSDRGRELFNASTEAYQKAVELLPEDADWRYGFADLLCNRAIWSESTYENWHVCLEMLKSALDLEPLHEGANELLSEIDYQQDFAWVEYELVDLSGDSPVFLLLSQTPAPTATETAPTLTDTRPVNTRTPTWTATMTVSATQTPPAQNTATVTNTIPPEPSSSPTQAPAQSVTQKTSGYLALGALLVLIFATIFLLIWRRRSNRG